MNLKKNVSLNELLSLKMATLQLEGKWATARNYQSVLRKIEHHYKVLPMKEVTSGLINDFKSKLKASGVSDSTIAVYFANIKAVFSYAVYKKYVKADQYPFRRHTFELDKVAIPKIQKRNDRFLEKADMQRVFQWWQDYKTDLNHKERRKQYVGLFLASYLCNGANIIDLMDLRYNSDYFRSGGKMLTFVRSKTKGRSDAKVTIPIIPQLQQILDDMAAAPADGGLVFPQFSNGLTRNDGDQWRIRTLTVGSECKIKLRRVAKELGLPDNISPTYARHSYSTVMHHSGVPFAVVEQNLGHANTGNVAFNYIGQASFDDLYKWNLNLL